MKIKKLTDDGLAKYKVWLANRDEAAPPADLLDGIVETEEFDDVEIDPDMTFKTRYDLGVYIKELFQNFDFEKMLLKENDGLWAWITLLYFSQLTEKGVRRSEHYIVTRQGVTGSLAYRHSVRTPYELVSIHGEGARICLSPGIHTFGDIAEQLTSRQNISRSRTFFAAAYKMYIENGKLKPGAATKAKAKAKRKPKDQAGRGGIRRLATALQRLNLTYDTDMIPAVEMIDLLPREFFKWKKKN